MIPMMNHALTFLLNQQRQASRFAATLTNHSEGGAPAVGQDERANLHQRHARLKGGIRVRLDLAIVLEQILTDLAPVIWPVMQGD